LRDSSRASFGDTLALTHTYTQTGAQETKDRITRDAKRMYDEKSAQAVQIKEKMLAEKQARGGVVGAGAGSVAHCVLRGQAGLHAQACRQASSQ
jgi:hypothetical protein